MKFSALHAVMVALGLTACSALPASAQPQTVVPCSEAALKAAITAANAAGGGRLVLTPRCTYNITAPTATSPSNGLPVITSPITVLGNGDTIARAQTAPDFRLFEIDRPNGNLTVYGLTVRNGDAGANVGGGFWLNGGVLGLNGSTVTRNTAISGGGIANEGGTLVLSSSTLSDNTAPAFGGGLTNQNATTTLNNSTVTGNSSRTGGGLVTLAFDTGHSRLTLNGSRVTNNSALTFRGFGGGIFIPNANNTTTLNNSLVSGNTASGPERAVAGGIANFGALTLNRTLVTVNTVEAPMARGGGLFNGSTGTAILRSSAVTGNRAQGADAQGGGVFNTDPGTVRLQASPVRANEPDNCGRPSTVPGCT